MAKGTAVNWDEKLVKENDALGGATDLRMDHTIAGAQWMRRQLCTDEAVERVALSLLRSDWPAHESDREYHWEHFADTCIEKARAATDALLGEDT